MPSQSSIMGVCEYAYPRSEVRGYPIGRRAFTVIAMNACTATVVSYTVLPDKAETLREAVEQQLVPAARAVSGYRGFLLLDQGDGKRLAVVVFDSAEHARSAQQTISAAARAAGIYEMMATSAGGTMGTAIVSDGIFGARA